MIDTSSARQSSPESFVSDGSSDLEPMTISVKNEKLGDENLTKKVGLKELEEFTAKKGSYADVTKDYWFKLMTGSDGGGINETFVLAILFLVFPQLRNIKNVDNLVAEGAKALIEIVPLSSRPDSNRRFATDFACRVNFKKKYDEVFSDVNGSGEGVTVSSPARNDTLRNAFNEGLIIVSEMQKSNIGNIVNRTDDYRAGHQIWTPSSSIGVIFEEDSNTDEIRISSVNHTSGLRSEQRKKESNEKVGKGAVIIHVPVPRNLAEEEKKNVEDLKKRSDEAVNEFFNKNSRHSEKNEAVDPARKLVQEVVFVTKHSQLMNPTLVSTFSPVVRKMCKRLELDECNINRAEKLKDKTAEEKIAYMKYIIGEMLEKEKKIEEENAELKRQNEKLSNELKRSVDILRELKNINREICNLGVGLGNVKQEIGSLSKIFGKFGQCIDSGFQKLEHLLGSVINFLMPNIGIHALNREQPGNEVHSTYIEAVSKVNSLAPGNQNFSKPSFSKLRCRPISIR